MSQKKMATTDTECEAFRGVIHGIRVCILLYYIFWVNIRIIVRLWRPKCGKKSDISVVSSQKSDADIKSD
jgi:hypothetical protein